MAAFSSLRWLPHLPHLSRRRPRRLRHRPAVAAGVGLAAGLLALAAAPAQARLEKLNQLFVFGDSLSDGGNSGLLTQSTPGSFLFPPPPYAGGRITNGPVASEVLWSLFNPGKPPLRPSEAGGTNFAVSGATTGVINFASFNPQVPANVRPAYANQAAATQLNSFLLQGASFDPASTLFQIWLFPNDVLFARGTGLDSGTVLGGGPQSIGPFPGATAPLISNGVSNISTMISALAAKGGTQFLVPNMPDLGAAPLFRGTATAPGLTALTQAFNASLEAELSQLEANLSGVEIMRVATDKVLADVLANPLAFGFDNTTDPCFDASVGSVCANPDRWLFWDDFHPTAAGHRVIASQFYGATLAPTPGPLPLAGGVSFLLCSRQLRRRIRAGRQSAPLS